MGVRFSGEADILLVMFGLKCCQEKACRMKKAFLLLKSLARFEFSICSKGTRLKRAMEKIRLYTTTTQ